MTTKNNKILKIIMIRGDMEKLERVAERSGERHLSFTSGIKTFKLIIIKDIMKGNY